MTLINSVKDPDDPHPWFDFELRSDLRAEIREATGLSAAAWTDAATSDEQVLVDDSAHSLAISAEKPMEEHVLAVTTEGEIDFVPRSEQRAVYYAHLAWYDPETDELDVLEFADPTTGETTIQ